jgi:flagellar basal-body rod modification protein FlgD
MFNNMTIPVAGAMNGTSKTASRGLADGDGSQFMLLLLAQLRNQNPLDPVQDKDFMGQVTQMNSLQELQKMNALLQSLSQSNRLTDAAGLIGKTVQFLAGNGGLQTGAVSGVTLQGDQAVLLVGSNQVALTDVVGVSDGEE